MNLSITALIFAALASTHAPSQPVQASAPQTQVAKPIVQDTGLKNITNVFTDTDIKQALSDMGAQAGIAIVGDDTVQGSVSVTLKDVPLEKALSIVLAPGNFSYAKMDGFYLVGKADPNSPNFLTFATTTVVKPDYISASRLLTLLPQNETPYVKGAPGEATLTITAPTAVRDRIISDIRLLDKPPVRIMMEALVTEMSTQVMNEYSFSWLWRQFGLASDISGTAFNYTKIAQSDVVTLKGLIGQGKAEVRANPRVMTVEGKEAMVEVAQENYFQVITGPASFPYASLQTIKTGISLKMTPMVASNGEITVDINPEVSDAQGNGANGLPSNTVRRAQTTVRIKEGETIVIGGMTYLNNRRTTNKIPVMGDLPLVGGLFRSRSVDSKKTDVIIMITPHIVRD